MNAVHPTAVVDPGAELGEDLIVGPYAVIEDQVVIGDRCRIDSHAVIRRHTRMGAGNHIHSHAMVGAEPQDLKFRGEVSRLEIGNDNVIREFASLHRGTAGGGSVTRVGDGNLLMAYVHVAHDCRLGNGVVMSNAASLAGHVTVEDHAVIGGITGIHQFVRIGTHAFVGAMSGVGMDIPPWMLAAGSRALVHGPNSVGLRRAGVGPEFMAAIKEAYRLIWRSRIPRAQALEQLEEQYGTIAEIAAFVRFIRESERGICAGARSARGEEYQ